MLLKKARLEAMNEVGNKNIKYNLNLIKWKKLHISAMMK